MIRNKNPAAIVLAAGKGTRLKAKKINKVMLPLNGKPMIGYTVDTLKKAGFEKMIIVVGFAKQSVIDYLGNNFIYAEQKKRLGTAHALKCALSKIPKDVDNIFVCYSDDSAFYPASVFRSLMKKHLDNKNDVTLLTVIKIDPTGLGRIVRNNKGKIARIVEEKNTTPKEKKIKEINTGLYCFSANFIKKYISLIKKDPIKGEYYLTDIVEIAIKNDKKIATMKIDKGDYFQGINTKEQLTKAAKKMKKLKKYGR
jgi:bifunctional UDP-N-acetylglucosamine pyrophosphorylase/glucosamine-1-phosphate N-acetyltransferase